MNIIKNIFLTLVIIQTLVFHCNAQPMECVDSVGNFYYNIKKVITSFGNIIPKLTDKRDNLILQLDTVNINGIVNLGITKLNSQNQLIYRKSYRQKLSTALIDYKLSFIDKENSIIISGGIQYDDITHSTGAIAKMDSAGNMRWQNMYEENSDTGNFFIHQSCQGKNEDIIAFMSEINRTNPYKISLLDSIGNIKWTKSYDSISDTTFVNVDHGFVLFNGTEIVLMAQFEYDTDGKSGFFISRIDYNTGRVVETKSYRIVTDYTNSSFIRTNNYNHLNYDSISRKYVIDLFPDDQLTQGLITIVLDENLNIINAKMFDFNVINSLGITTINSSNNIAYCWSDFKDTSLLYAIIDDNLNLISQKKIQLGSYPVKNYFGDAVFRKNNLFNIQISSIGNYGLNNFLLLGGSSSYHANNACLGYDTTYLMPKDITVTSLNIGIDVENNIAISAINIPVMISEDKPLPTQVFCKQLSICDTIKIHAVSQYCLSDSIAQFTLFKNFQCLHKTEWNVDTTAFKIIAKPNDTTLIIQFLKSYNGYIYAGFAGCELKDSIKINVLKPKQNFVINKDSILCPGKNILLQSSAGFKSYQWQDGSLSPSLLVTNAGDYKVTATDSCGNIFEDSIVIKDGDTSFMVSKFNRICLDDTLHLNISLIKNIAWQPFANTLQNKNELLFFPKTTTQYSLIGKSINNCDVSASLKIEIRDCPEYIYFPNSFTPNRDGLNDVFRSFAEGKFDLYDLKIFNRWGQLVFHNTNSVLGWDGNYYVSHHPTHLSL